MIKRTILTILILGALGGGIYGLLQILPNSNASNNGGIRVDAARARDLTTVVPAAGEVRPLLNSIVKSEISGRLTRLAVREGESVERGQVLLELDRTSLETRLREAERSLQAENLRVEKARRNFSRLEELWARDFIGERDYLDAETDLRLAALNLEIAQARLEDAEEDLSKTTIRAPHHGVVTLLSVVEGQVITGATSVSNGTDLITIAQLDELFMEANINEVDVERLSLGQTAILRFDAIPDFQVKGEIGVIAPSARRDGNVRVFPIEVFFEVDDNRVRPGISATVEIPIASVQNVVSVLLSAVFNDRGESIVYVKNETGWERRIVEVGINNLQHVEIVAGLAEGESVALSRPPQFSRSDG